MNNWDEVKIITWNCGAEEEEWAERHTSGDGEDCHANCCDVCVHDDEGYNFVDGRVRRDEDCNP